VTLASLISFAVSTTVEVTITKTLDLHFFSIRFQEHVLFSLRKIEVHGF